MTTLIRATALAAALTLATSATAFATERLEAIGSGLSTISPEAQTDLTRCLSDESSSRAVRSCTKSLRAATPNDDVRAHIYTRRALHRLALGRFDDASGDFSRAAELKGDASLASVGDGFAAMMDSDLSTAREKFKDCSQSASVAPLAAYGLGLTHQMAGETLEARDAYQQALTLRPGWDAVEVQIETLEAR